MHGKNHIGEIRLQRRENTVWKSGALQRRDGSSAEHQSLAWLTQFVAFFIMIFLPPSSVAECPIKWHTYLSASPWARESSYMWFSLVRNTIYRISGSLFREESVLLLISLSILLLGILTVAQDCSNISYPEDEEDRQKSCLVIGSGHSEILYYRWATCLCVFFLYKKNNIQPPSGCYFGSYIALNLI